MKLTELPKAKLDRLVSLQTEDELNAFLDAEDVEIDDEILEKVSEGGFFDVMKEIGKLVWKTEHSAPNDAEIPMDAPQDDPAVDRIPDSVEALKKALEEAKEE